MLGSVSIEAPKFVRINKIEGRTILPSGEIVPLDSSKVFRGKAYTEGKSFAILASSFTFPSVQPGAIIEYQVEEIEDWFYPSPWIFDTPEVGTLQSSLKVTVGPRLGMAQFPLDTTANKISITQSQTVKGTLFEFSVNNLKPVLNEPFSFPFRDLSTMIIFTPTQLGFGGDVYPLITKWDDVGKEVTDEFNNNLGKSAKETRSKAKELAEKLPDARAKTEAIYKYIQANITSSDLAGVALGRPADEILSTKRGDPDEINALFVFMLKEVKIDADMVSGRDAELANAGSWISEPQPVLPNRHALEFQGWRRFCRSGGFGLAIRRVAVVRSRRSGSGGKGNQSSGCRDSRRDTG